MESKIDNCCICSKPAYENCELVHVSPKAVKTLLKSCNIRKASDVRTNIVSDMNNVYVHSDCRKFFTDSKRQKQVKRKQASDSVVQSKRVRSELAAFDWKTCFYCSKKINFKNVLFKRGSKLKSIFHKVETILAYGTSYLFNAKKLRKNWIN